jgi:tetratricopeptide (TPR) repeat protein
MIKHKQIAMLIVALALTGCATTVTVPVQRPAEINLKGVKRIAIGEITGHGGEIIADLVTSKLFESGRFEVLERAQMEKIFKEHALSLTGAIDPTTAAQLGKLTGAQVLILGNVAMYKTDPIQLKTRRYETKKGVHYDYEKTVTAKVNFTLKVVELETGKILAVKTINEEAKRTTSETDEYPPDPDKDAALNEAVNKAVDQFIKTISPYWEQVKVKFCRPGIFKSPPPDLREGERLAKAGMWEEALEKFKAAAESRPTDKCAWYDLGIAYLYTNRFNEAEKAFKEAFKLGCQEAVKQIAIVKRRIEEVKKLEEQIEEIEGK